ncbi:DUF3077 domain-containing protein [Pseudomonas shirazensis]|uniref:DUF3077 domain-containing protein n=1 Tax=Pseudomonas shirazensis TaxID=2745494 RepID=UPI003D2D5DF2
MDNHQPHFFDKVKTVGVGQFGESVDLDLEKPLFRVQAGHPLTHALEQATVLMCTVHKLTDLALADQQEVPTLLTALHYLSGMAKALAQDVNHGLMVHTLGKLPSQS